MTKKNNVVEYDFNEKTHEYSSKQNKDIPVWVSPKYTQTRAKAIEVIEKFEAVTAEDFWILMNETRNGKMAYTGLIISHNACLKINEALEDKDKFRPECMSLDKDGYGDSLVFSYICPEQGIYEVGEVSKNNCKNAYPYAMALKRCMDRVILKSSKIAFDGIYSDSEADEFKERIEAPADEPKAEAKEDNRPTVDELKDREKLIEDITRLLARKGMTFPDFYKIAKCEAMEELNNERLQAAVKYLESLRDKVA